MQTKAISIGFGAVDRGVEKAEYRQSISRVLQGQSSYCAAPSTVSVEMPGFPFQDRAGYGLGENARQGLHANKVTAPAHAENFVQVFLDEEAEIFAEADVDSIRKDTDGLLYFTVSADIGITTRDIDDAVRPAAEMVPRLNQGHHRVPPAVH